MVDGNVESDGQSESARVRRAQGGSPVDLVSLRHVRVDFSARNYLARILLAREDERRYPWLGLRSVALTGFNCPYVLACRPDDLARSQAVGAFKANGVKTRCCRSSLRCDSNFLRWKNADNQQRVRQSCHCLIAQRKGF